LAFISYMDMDDLNKRSKIEELYVRFHREMYYIAMSILHNTHDAQDAVQTAILKCINYIDKIDDFNCNRTKNLIVTIIKSVATDIYRRKKRLQHEKIEDFMEPLMVDDQFTDDLIFKLSDGEYYAQRLAGLKPEYAEILTLRYYNELTNQEIAQILNISHENVRARLSRAKAALKKIIMEKCEEWNERQRGHEE
jgi:RNA polymerase sigma-70 factor (ECF subfamily)